MPRLANFLAAALAAVAAAPSGAEAASVPWKDCGSKGFKISSVTASPYPFQKGTNASMTISGSLAATFSAGTYYQSASVWGYSIGNSTGNACGPFLDCPASAGPVDIVMTMNVPSNAPTATYDLTMTLTASDGSNVMCIDMDPEIGSGAAQEPADFFSGPSDDEPVNNELHFAYINKRASTWTAGHNERWEGLTYGHVRGLCGALKTPEFLRLPVRRAPVPASIPATFDSRQHWGSECPILNDIRDQGSCGSCWAVSAASTQTDRTCIFYNGTASPYLSGSDILSCCGFWCGSGCDGGYPSSAQSYWVSTGVVDGGVYGDTNACLPYQVAPCEHHVSGSRPPCVEGGDTPACPSTCENGADWASSKHFGATSYSVSSDPAQIQAEILAHGPVQASFTVYADFPSYKSGVYKQTSTDELGGHAVKIIGWGTENGTPYWLVVNSWNTDWGDNGLFKIVRGQDECGIEDGIVAGLPK